MLQFETGRAVRETRMAAGWSQAELGRRSGISKGMIGKIEIGAANCTFAVAGRLIDELGIRASLRLDAPFIVDRRRQREPIHARCSAYVRRRLEADGWTVHGEVEIVHGQSHGWIDLLAWHPTTRTVLVIEIKTELHDLGQIERTMGWYEREAWAAARRLGWRPVRVVSALVVLMTSEVEGRVRENVAAIASGFRVRGSALARWVADPSHEWARGARGLALIDPHSRRREWLRPTWTDGRRTPPPYADYADAVRRLARRSRAGAGRSR